MITLGLAYYSSDNMEKALSKFAEADNVEGWLRNAGKEVLYLMIGNAYAKKASMEKTSEELPKAEEAYQNALDIRPSYARALLGKAGVLYLLALGDPNDPSFDTVDLKMLKEAEREFIETKSLKDQDENANIRVKADFSLGQIYYVYAQIEDVSWYTRAIAAFQSVIKAYEQGNDQIMDFASHSYARLGLIDRSLGNPASAISHYRKAINTSTPLYQAYYHTRIAEI